MNQCKPTPDKTDGRYPFDTVNEMIERHLSDIHADDETTPHGTQKTAETRRAKKEALIAVQTRLLCNANKAPLQRKQGSFATQTRLNCNANKASF